jgi:hypothetical protein
MKNTGRVPNAKGWGNVRRQELDAKRLAGAGYYPNYEESGQTDCK